MRRVKQILLLLLAVVLMLGATACATQEPFDAGEPLTPKELQDLKNGIAAEDAKGDGTTEEEGDTKAEDETPPAPSAPSAETTVYWLPKGSVYHTDSTCYHIKEKPIVQSGTVAMAEEAGKTRLCSACAD